MDGELRSLKAALGLSVALIAGEHFFSAGMSSPWSVAKFAKTDTDHAQVWTLFAEAAVGSMAFAVAVGLLMRDKAAFAASLAGGAVIVAWMYWDYRRALDGTLGGSV